ncbi:SDR family NAD(P)-dependent oxidoreductase [Armatimonas rosea]|uniref:3-oxoacyl-[acyl-carrier protein] reductase n=1 Tax=Armatimonas rosea TaxID=685828 RepID=A0A7W9SM85_ARMRO|nr:3-oxoacyl-[acyl-carrier protein] reductase [Armatimonas rosea]
MRVALVTGAGSGVGRAVAVALAQEGFSVALVGRRREKLEETAALTGGRIFVGDASDPVAMERVLAELGPVSVLVNNAGVHNGFDKITESDPERWRQTLLTNVYAPYLLSRLCAPGMKALGWGRLIQVSSAAGFAPPDGPGADYILSKYTLNFFTRQLAAELVGSELSCCAIHPGEVKTEMWEDIKDFGGMPGWAELVERTGGDPPEKASELVCKIVAAPASETNGKFLWIEGGIQAPRFTW